MMGDRQMTLSVAAVVPGDRVSDDKGFWRNVAEATTGGDDTLLTFVNPKGEALYPRTARVEVLRSVPVSDDDGVPLYRIVDERPFLDLEEEHPGLTLDAAALRMEDLTGVSADVILADFDEPCWRCDGAKVLDGFTCGACWGDGKRAEPWAWEDDESNRVVTLRREVE